MDLTLDIKEKALEIGFDVVGVTNSSAISVEHIERMQTWLQAGYAGRMDYLYRNFEKRTNPALLLENAQFVDIPARSRRVDFALLSSVQRAQRKRKHGLARNLKIKERKLA